MNTLSYRDRIRRNRSRESAVIEKLRLRYNVGIEAATKDEDIRFHTDAWLRLTPTLFAAAKAQGAEDLVITQEYPIQIKIRENPRAEVGVEAIYDSRDYVIGDQLTGREYEHDSLFWISVTPAWLVRLYLTDHLMAKVEHAIHSSFDAEPTKNFIQGHGYQIFQLWDKGEGDKQRQKVMVYLDPTRLNMVQSWQLTPP